MTTGDIHNLNDVGTRYVHYRELLELWEEGLEYLQRRSKESLGVEQKKQVSQLEAGITVLRKRIDVLALYEDSSWEQRRMVNAIPSSPELTKGGRGTPLN